MGLRGPKPKSKNGPENPTTVRLPADLRRRLEKACQAEGDTTLSQEIIRRLEGSFEEKSRGSGLTPALLSVMEIALINIHRATGHHWHENAFSHRLAVEAVDTILHHFQPKGRPVVPEDHPALMRAQELNLERLNARKRDKSAVPRSINLKEMKKRLGEKHGAEIALEAIASIEVAPDIDLPPGDAYIQSAHFQKNLSLARTITPRLARLGRKNDALERLNDYWEGKPPRKVK